MKQQPIETEEERVELSAKSCDPATGFEVPCPSGTGVISNTYAELTGIKGRIRRQWSTKCATTFLCLLPLLAHADLLYQNQGCGEVQPSADALRQAFREGREVRIYLTREANGIIEEYMTVITAARFDEPVIAALIPLRPGIDAHANATSAGSIVAGSIDTQGHYRYGSYRFGSTATGDTKSLCFSISWFGQ